MGTPWDSATPGYFEEWVPRFVPYHTSLVHELVLADGQRVLVAHAGSGAEVLSARRIVGASGYVRATDTSAEMIARLSARLADVGFDGVECDVAGAADTRGAPFHAILCAFALWREAREADRSAVLSAWARALHPSGKIGIMTWGPTDPEDPFEIMASALQDVEGIPLRPHAIDAARASMNAMFGEAGLSMVRHTVVRHTLNFPSAEVFARGLQNARSWRELWDRLGEARAARVTARFFEKTGGPGVPLTCQPPATIAIAALPGADVELAHRPSVRVPLVGD
jgi:ubiquinone/menaquinone biosynthesis C-methylase UbiE